MEIPREVNFYEFIEDKFALNTRSKKVRFLKKAFKWRQKSKKILIFSRKLKEEFDSYLRFRIIGSKHHPLDGLIHKTATTTSECCPNGFIEIDQTIYVAISDVGFIAAGTPVWVCSRDINNLRIRTFSPPEH